MADVITCVFSVILQITMGLVTNVCVILVLQSNMTEGLAQVKKCHWENNLRIGMDN